MVCYRSSRRSYSEISAQKGVDSLRTVMHIGIGRAGRVIPLVMLARLLELRQLVMDVDLARSRLWPVVGRIERQCRRAGKRGTHQREGAEHVGPHERAPSCDRGSKIVSGDQRYIAITEGRDETQSIPNRIQKPEGSEIAVIVSVPAGGAPVASEVRGHDMKAGRRKWRHDLSPGVGELRKPVQQQDQGTPLGLKAGLQHVYPQTIDIRHEAGADTRRNRSTFQRPDIDHARLVWMDRPRSLAENAENKRVRRADRIIRRRRLSIAR
jgi:hypothetical protein